MITVIMYPLHLAHCGEFIEFFSEISKGRHYNSLAIVNPQGNGITT